MQTDEAKERVRAQYAASGDAYVVSAGHAAGNDLARLVELADPRPTDRALDVATGGGHVARALAPRVAEVVASDLTPEMLATAERFLSGGGPTNITYRQADAEALPFPDGSFDLVTCRIAPHHFPNPDQFTAEVARVLTPGGRFALVDSTVPSGELGDRFNAFERRRDPSHVRSLPISEWRGLLAAAGLAVETVESFPKRHDFVDWAARARVPEADIPALAALLLDAGPEAAAVFLVERAGDTLLAFTDEKTLFLARRPDAPAS